MATYPSIPSNATLAQLVRWAQDLIPILKRRDTEGGQLLELASYVVAELPTLGVKAGTQVFVVDEAGGAVPAFFDGTNWRRMTDRAVVS